MGLNQYVGHMGQYHSNEADKIRVSDNETDHIRSFGSQITKIRNETDYIKNTDKSPPSWKMNYLPSLNIIS